MMSAAKRAFGSSSQSRGELSTFQLLMMSQQPSNSSLREGGGGSGVKAYVPLQDDPKYADFIDRVGNAESDSSHRAPPPSSSAAKSLGGGGGGGSASRNKR